MNIFSWIFQNETNQFALGKRIITRTLSRNYGSIFGHDLLEAFHQKCQLPIVIEASQLQFNIQKY